jgi:starch synthase
MSRILMVASEAAPFVKTGGLADVLGSLPAALVERGDEVAVVLPRYRLIYGVHSERIWYDMPLSVGPHFFRVAIDQVIRNGVRYLMVDCPPLYDRAGIYDDWGWGYGDNHLRYALLCQAAIGISRGIFRPDVFHGHDWQAGLLPTYLKNNLSGDPTFFGTKTVFTIHNLGYQGTFDKHKFGDLGLDWSVFHSDGLEFWDQINLLKAGIVYSDAVTTVSPTYAREIQTPEFGFSMDPLLRSRAYKLTGILNGIDYNEWNPETDPHLPAHYSSKDLGGKAVCKRALLDHFNLPPDMDRPLLGIVSRFADQKGFDIFADISGWLAQQDVAVAVLGSGEPRFEEMFNFFARVHPDRFGVHIGYDNALAHRIEAGCDMFLMPSRYEPCGLNQMYSLRYGTPPIVRSTGGLADTVNHDNGFLFYGYAPSAFADTITYATECFRDRAAWTKRQRNGMSMDLSWGASAAEYQRLYRA